MGVRAFACLAFGVGAALWLGPGGTPWWAFAALLGAAASVVAVAARGRVGWASLACAAALLGFVVGAARTFEYPARSVGRLLGDGMTILDVEGVILEPPSVARPTRGQLARFVRDEPATRFALRVTGARENGAWRPANGDLWVRIAGVATGLRAGDAVRLSGQAFGVEAPTNPGERDFRARARERNIAGRLLVPDGALVERADDGRGVLGGRVALLAALRGRASAWLDGLRVGEEARALLGAALFGETEGAYTRVQRTFARTGLAHILAISGLHLALLAWFALRAVRLVVASRAAQSAVVALVVVVYLLVVPANPPVVRAGAMTLGFLLAEAFGRRYDRLNVLAWTACAIVLVRPTDLASVGFQLSFLAVGGLIALGPRVRDAMLRALRVPLDEPETRTLAQRWLARGCAALAAAVSAWAVTAPLVAMRVGLVTPLGALASAAVAPFFALLLFAGYVATAASLLAPTVAFPFAWAAGALAEGFVRTVGVIDALPLGAVRTPPFGWWWAALATVAIAMALRGVRVRASLVALTIVCAAVWIGGRRAPAPGGDVALRIDTLDVGDGSCHLIRAANGESLLWDCGSTWVGVGERDIPEALRALGAWRVRTLAISHPNLDHYSGVLDAAERLGLRTVLTTPAFLEEADRDPLGPVAFTVRSLRARGVEVRAIEAGHAMTLGDARVTVLWPAEGFASERANDESLVARISVATDAGERAALLLGDIEPAGIDAMTKRVGALAVQIVEAPHHGSARPGAIAFVGGLAPRVVLQSTGPQRLNDERWDAVRAHTQWRCTAAEGAVYGAILRDGSVVSGRSTPIRPWAKAPGRRPATPRPPARPG